MKSSMPGRLSYSPSLGDFKFDSDLDELRRDNNLVGEPRMAAPFDADMGG